MTRTTSTIKNIGYALIGQFLGTLTVFISRIFFLKVLSTDYLGLNGLFTNILTVLSFAELGFGTAITFSLYNPLVNDDKEKIKSLMYLYKIIYRYVTVIIFVIGSILTPFLKYLIADMPDISDIYVIYLLYVINTSISYVCSYKKTLVIADQNRYIATFYRYFCYIFLNIIQTIVLLIFRNYIIYMIIQIFFTFLENYLISKKADKMYPYLLDKNVKKLGDNEKKDLFKNTKAMLMHKIGGILVNSTDNIILSKYVGLSSVGIYSNYLIIKQALISITGQIFNATSAGIGNLCADNESNEKKVQVFYNLNFASFVIYSITSIGLVNVLVPFITLWIGEEYIFSTNINLMFILIYYITGMRNPVLTYREAMGLFYKDRYKAIIEAIVNLLFSIVLAKKIGTIGVLLGTLISSIGVSVWVEIHILFKYGFKLKPKHYIERYIVYFILTILMSIITNVICNKIAVQNLFFKVIINGVISVVTSIGCICILYRKTDEFKYFKELFKMILQTKQRKSTIK